MKNKYKYRVLLTVEIEGEKPPTPHKVCADVKKAVVNILWMDTKIKSIEADLQK